jgi:phosphatidylinositol N-acetylglucosaminyltransferase subunit Q
VDSWSYDLDQLLFGTILFTLTAFIFPTTFTYYVLFAAVSISHYAADPVLYLTNALQCHLVTFLILALLNVALVLINQFPLFALLLRIKDPSRLPSKLVAEVAHCLVLTVHRWHYLQAQ